LGIKRDKKKELKKVGKEQEKIKTGIYIEYNMGKIIC
jgi:hypothetical protein